MSTHTPGPWYYVTGAVWGTPGGPDDGGACIATRASNAPIDPCTRDANLRLCAAAPALLAALRDLADANGNAELRAAWSDARAAIAAAEGAP